MSAMSKEDLRNPGAVDLEQAVWLAAGRDLGWHRACRLARSRRARRPSQRCSVRALRRQQLLAQDERPSPLFARVLLCGPRLELEPDELIVAGDPCVVSWLDHVGVAGS
jgi:hypothetical protein